MSNNIQLKNKLEQIEECLESLEQLSRLDLVRQKALGEELSFKKGENSFKKIFDLFLPLKGLDLSNIPIDYLDKLENQLSTAISNLGEILKFNANQSNPSSERDRLIATIDNGYSSFFQSVFPIICYIHFYNKSDNDSTGRIKSLLVEAQQEREKMARAGDDTLNEIKSILESARQAAGKLGVAQFSKTFQEESVHHSKIANKWLVATIGVMIALVLSGGAFLYFTNHGTEVTNTPYLIQLTVTKLLVLTVLFYALNLCSKNYRSHTHNSILNRHRQNALNTFETFVKASGEDGQTKNAVLLEATRTIFSNQQTGYLNSENEVEFPSRIIEIIKSNKE